MNHSNSPTPGTEFWITFFVIVAKHLKKKKRKHNNFGMINFSLQFQSVVYHSTDVMRARTWATSRKQNEIIAHTWLSHSFKKICIYTCSGRNQLTEWCYIVQVSPIFILQFNLRLPHRHTQRLAHVVIPNLIYLAIVTITDIYMQWAKWKS